jgi:hypothetical protein
MARMSRPMSKIHKMRYTLEKSACDKCIHAKIVETQTPHF